MFLQASVILSTGGGVPDQVHPPGPGAPPDQVHPPRPGTPPTRYTPPPDQVHLPRTRYTPPAQSMLGDTVIARAVRILLECILVFSTSQCLKPLLNPMRYIEAHYPLSLLMCRGSQTFKLSRTYLKMAFISWVTHLIVSRLFGTFFALAAPPAGKNRH